MAQADMLAVVYWSDMPTVLATDPHNQIPNYINQEDSQNIIPMIKWYIFSY